MRNITSTLALALMAIALPAVAADGTKNGTDATPAAKADTKASTSSTPSRDAINAATGNETRPALQPTVKKKTAEEKAKEQKLKQEQRASATKEEAAKAAKTVPGG